jgi:hypothetical protein
MGRRQVAESVNSALKGAFVDLARGFFRVLGEVKITVLLGFTVAATTSIGFAASGPSRRPRPRVHRTLEPSGDAGTWAAVVGAKPSGFGALDSATLGSNDREVFRESSECRFGAPAP